MIKDRGPFTLQHNLIWPETVIISRPGARNRVGVGAQPSTAPDTVAALDVGRTGRAVAQVWRRPVADGRDDGAAG
jgi:hypothetical protein